MTGVSDPAIAVIVPAAPRDDVADTVDSVVRWLPGSPVLVLNDGDDLLEFAEHAQVTVLPALPFARNAFGGLFTKLGYGLDWILHNTDAEYILRLDADAVMLRPGLAPAVASVFDADPRIGIAGGVCTHGDGSRRDPEPAAMMVRSSASFSGLRRPRARRVVRALLANAHQHGYVDGEHAIACACVLRTEMVRIWRDRGWLKPGALAAARLGDDHLLGLMCYASGYRTSDVGGPNGLFALSWRGLPASPEKLLAGPTYATHSVRAFEEMTERQIREFFAQSRRTDPT